MKRIVALMAVVAVMCSACVTPYPTEEIGKVAKSTAALQSTFTTYYANLNAYRLATYIRTRVYQGLPVSTGDAPLAGPIYEPKAIETRLAALKLVGRYAELLNAYATGSEAKDLGGAAAGFTNAAFELQGALSKDESASKYAGPVSGLVSLSSQWAAQAYLRGSLTKQLPEATTGVKAVLNLLREDADSVLKPTQLVNTSQDFAALVTYYNSRADTMSLPDRVQMAQLLIDAAAARDAARSIDLVGLINAAEKAIDKLQARVAGAATAEDTAAALNEFAERVETLRKSLEDLEKAQKG